MSHFERFNREARSVLARAQNEAIPRDHTRIEPAHILMGMARERRSFAADALRRVGLLEPALVLALDYGPDEWKQGRIGDIELSARSRNVLACTVKEWQALRHDRIGTMHLLLGICRDEEETGPGILRSLGLEPALVRAELQSVIDEYKPNLRQRLCERLRRDR